MSHARGRCMDCAAPPTRDVRWAEGLARAWFCERHYQAWAKKHPGEICAEHRIASGEVPVTRNGNKKGKRK